MSLRSKIIEWLKTLFADIRKTIIGVIVVGLIGLGGGLLAISKTGLNFLLQILNMPTPIWATILLVLLCFVYIRIRIVQNRSITDTPLQYNMHRFTMGNLAWDAKVYAIDRFELIGHPFCSAHNLRMIRNNNEHICPFLGDPQCDNRIADDIYERLCKTAYSYIEQRIRNNDYED